MINIHLKTITRTLLQNHLISILEPLKFNILMITIGLIF